MSSTVYETVDIEEVYLRSHNEDGSVLHEGRLPLRAGTGLQVILNNLFPPVIAIGEEGRDTHPFTSTRTFDTAKGGIGLFHDDPAKLTRVWWSTARIDYDRQVTLPRRKVERTSPSASATPRGGIVFNNKVYVCFDTAVHRWDESSAAWSASLHAMAAVPAGEPILWGTYVYWPMGASGILRYDGATFTTYTNATINGIVGGVVYNNRLYFVKSTGEVVKTNAADYALATLTSVGTVSDTPTGMLIYFNGAGAYVPYVIGKRGLYSIDDTNGLIVPAGPWLPPARGTLRADVLGGNNNVYVAQNMTVVQWTGEVATPVGLDNDDGVPVDQRGRIVKLLNGGLDLYALVDAASVVATSYAFGKQTTPNVVDPSALTAGYSALYKLSGTAWGVVATSGSAATSATMLFISDAEDTYRLWFSWDKIVYTVDLDEGLFNPLDNPSGEFESTAEIIYPEMDMTWKEHPKSAMEANIRVAGITGTANRVRLYVAFDDGGWTLLADINGADGDLDGRYTIPIHADPGRPSTEEPAVGKPHDTAQLRLVLDRDPAVLTTTPIVDYVDWHVLKVVEPIIGFRFTVDMTKPDHDNLSPWERRTLLYDLLDDQAERLLHFAYNPDPEGSPGAARVYAVKISGLGGAENSGLAADHAGNYTVTLTEVT